MAYNEKIKEHIQNYLDRKEKHYEFNEKQGYFKLNFELESKLKTCRVIMDIQEDFYLVYSNHLISFESSLDVLDIQAVFNRLLYIPFQNRPISDKEDNKHLSDILFEERDLIFTWAIKGLREYVENNETFPISKLSEEVKQANMSKYCPEKVFFNTYLKEASGYYESSSAIKDAFSEFCYENNVSKKADIGRFLDEHQRIPKMKKRIDDKGNLTSIGNPIYVYEGIRLKNKYRKYNK